MVSARGRRNSTIAIMMSNVQRFSELACVKVSACISLTLGEFAFFSKSSAIPKKFRACLDRMSHGYLYSLNRTGIARQTSSNNLRPMTTHCRWNMGCVSKCAKSQRARRIRRASRRGRLAGKDSRG